MLKYKLGIICLLMAFFPSFARADGIQALNMEINGRFSNLTYESTYQTVWFNSSLSFLLGLRFEQLTCGLEADIDYFSYNTVEQAASSLKGGWFDVRGLILLKYRLLPWLNLKAGLGGLWLQSALNYNEEGWTSSGEGGLACIFNAGFSLPWSFIDLEWQNKIDFLFVDKALRSIKPLNVYYLGGIQANFHPGLSWLTFYTSINILAWSSITEAYEPKIWTICMNLGAAVDLNLGGKAGAEEQRLPSERKPALHPLTSSPMDDNSAGREDDYEQISPSLKVLLQAPPGKAVNFPDLLFKDGETEPLPGTELILDRIAEILSIRENIIVAIAGYSELFNEPEKEISIAGSRAQYIKQYLITRGIEKARLMINPVTHIAFEQSKTRIVISIIDSK